LARKSNTAATPHVTLSQVKFRLARALNEGRFTQALELAKQVYRAEPSATNQDALFNAYLGRGRELRAQHKLRDAATTLQDVVRLVDGNPSRLLPLAEELAACGEPRQALLLVQHEPDSAARQRVFARAADVAVRREETGRALLPDEMRGDFDRVLRAFAALEAGQDQAAREVLQRIGLRSPFLEWKLLLRGMLAYYQNDDARAIDNWQRLDAERLPARLAAPLRARIDAAYRLAQPPAAQNSLRQQSDRLQDPGLALQLRIIQSSLAKEGDWGTAFRAAETLLPALRQQAPDLVPRLAACFYWAIINSGYPDDVPRYVRAFGLPPDDPDFHRLQALACERHHDLAGSHPHWRNFEKSIAANPVGWPGEEGKRARALIWLHAGRNAAKTGITDRIPGLPRFLRDHPDRPKPLKPSADKCYENSIKLAPDLLGAHEALFAYHRENQDSTKAEKAARQLLQRFPDHGPTLEGLADLLGQTDRHAEALESLSRALHHHPLDRDLRAKLGIARLHHARSLAEAGRFEEARAEFLAALDSKDSSDESSVLWKWAACEFKAGDNARAEELLGQARERSATRLAVAFGMAIEASRFKLPRPLKTRLDREFADALTEPPTTASAVAALELAAVHRVLGIEYTGQKTHEKKVLAYLDGTSSSDFTEPAFAEVCKSLLALKAVRALRAYCKRAARRFPRAAIFPFLEAESYFVRGPERVRGAWQAGPLLDTAHRLAMEMPSNEQRTRLLQQISDRKKLVQLLDFGPLGVFQSILDRVNEFDDELDDDEW